MSDDKLRLKLGVDTACEIAEAQGLQFERLMTTNRTPGDDNRSNRRQFITNSNIRKN